MTIRIHYRGLPVPACQSDRKNTKQKFECWLDDGTVIGKNMKSPALDGARALIAMGYDPDALMTTKSSTSEYDSWTAQPIGKFAKLAVHEPDDRSAHNRIWAAFRMTETEKTGEAVKHPNAHTL